MVAQGSRCQHLGGIGVHCVAGDGLALEVMHYSCYIVFCNQRVTCPRIKGTDYPVYLFIGGLSVTKHLQMVTDWILKSVKCFKMVTGWMLESKSFH